VSFQWLAWGCRWSIAPPGYSTDAFEAILTNFVFSTAKNFFVDVLVCVKSVGSIRKFAPKTASDVSQTMTQADQVFEKP
jgi:hypothetical protein